MMHVKSLGSVPQPDWRLLLVSAPAAAAAVCWTYFQGMFAVARRFYLLFQQHCRYDNAHTISKTMGDFCYHQVPDAAAAAVAYICLTSRTCCNFVCSMPPSLLLAAFDISWLLHPDVG
jgi:hypothetical protein